jgi:hypothetical protein
VGESEVGNEWRWEEDSREGWGFYTGFLVLGARCTRRVALDVEGGVSGWHCRLSLGMWSAVLVAQRSGRGGLGLRPCVTETGLAWVGTRGQGGKVMGAEGRRHRAVLVLVQGDAGVASCVLERDARSGRSQRLADIGLARSGRVVQ